MRRAAKIDTNHTEIVDYLRDRGATVQSLASLGKGCPDLLVAYNGYNILIEVKMPKGKLTPDQISWHGVWNSTVHVVHSVEEAEAILQYYRF